MTSCGGYFCGTEMVYEHEIVGLINDNELNGVLFHWPIYETADRVVVRYSINNRNWRTWHFSLNVNLLDFDWRTHAVSGHVTVWNLCTLGVYWQNVSLLTWFVWLTGNVIELIDQVVIFWSVSRLADESLVPSLVTVNNLFFFHLRVPLCSVSSSYFSTHCVLQLPRALASGTLWNKCFRML